MTKDWFQYETNVYEKEERYYLGATSSFFDEFIASWQRIASKMYPVVGHWMIETGKRVTEPIPKMGQNIEITTKIHDVITDILDELISVFYFDYVES